MSKLPMTPAETAVHSQPLTRPIQAWGQSIDTIHFREPRAGDITRHGRPVKFTPFTDFGDIAFDEPKMTAMIAALSGIPEGSIDTMNPQDWESCAWGLTRFFIPGFSTIPAGQPSNSQSTSEATSSPTSIAPQSSS